MKHKPRQRRPQANAQQQQAAIALDASSGMTANAFVSPAGKTKHGPRKEGRRRQEHAQAAITALFPDTLPKPKHVNQSKLARDVNNRLARDPKYRAANGDKRLSRQTVMRALAALRKAKTADRLAHLGPVQLSD